MPASPPESFVTTLARQIDPDAWQLADNTKDDEAKVGDLTRGSLQLATRLERFLADCGVPCSPPRSLGDAITRNQALVSKAEENLARFCAEARGDLDTVITQIQDLATDLQDLADDIVCIECGAFNNDGEGSDGRCGICADREFADETD